MRADWDESFFDAQREDPSVYWVCFWTGDDIEQAAQHDPQRIEGAGSVEEVLEWLHSVKGERRFELFVETVGHAETRASGWTAHRTLVRLAGDFEPAGTTHTITLTAEWTGHADGTEGTERGRDA
ncbi:hypothetical protein SAMN06295885_3645 [Rathayibacter oskolensis]|uniref:Uncharacterized protein n=1 Tax=Rathayibacter oskolensis TaxID=1891671 RepID=A0A1X7PHG5_9MICO|nr:hypothetical protein [Rathayibacter oskolensis]SMH50986.1 hypothetical protein SAMN06295885_3645 [Rathayibacter oskolensis]